MLYFQVYGNMVEENSMYQQLQKICRENVYRRKVFGKIWGNSVNISQAPPKSCLLLHLWIHLWRNPPQLSKKCLFVGYNIKLQVFLL